MLKSIATIAISIAVAAMALFATLMPASAAECKKYEYTVPAGVTLLGEKELLATFTGNTLDAFSGGGYMRYFDPNGTTIFQFTSNRRTTHGKWRVCGEVLVMDHTENPFGKILERLVSDAGNGKFSLYDLSGKHLATRPVVKGKGF